MATIDEDLAQLERDIRQLKIEYDMFFGGGRKRPPTEIEWRIELDREALRRAWRRLEVWPAIPLHQPDANLRKI